MTVYVGEYVRIGVTSQVQTELGVYEPLTEDEIDSAKITIWSSENDELVDDDLIYDDEDRWYFDWDTVGQEAGRYKVRCLFTGPGNHRSWEYGTIKLTRDKAPVAP